MASLDQYTDPTVITVVKIPYITFGSVSDATALQATDAIGITYRVARIYGSGGPVTLTSTPSITAGEYDGQRLTIHGTDDTLTVTLQDESSLTSSGLRMLGGYNMTYGNNDTSEFMWYSADSVWVELHRGDSY